MKKIIYLSYINELQTRLNAGNRHIQVILGPRQVGKTTTILKLIEEYYAERAHYVSAEILFNASSIWLREQWIYAQQSNRILFIDEVQKIYNWAETIKALYDEARKEKKEIQCVLLGSSSLNLQKGLSESLTGRFQLLRAYHWNYEESNAAYGIGFDEYLRFGGYPGSYEFIGTKDWIDYVRNSIVSTVVEKDILQFHTVRNPSLFRQAFELLISYPAQEISYTKLLGQLQDKGNVELIKNYMNLFEGAYLISSLEKYSNKPFLRKSSSPKILPLAPSLYGTSIRGELSSEEEGRVFEAVVGSQLLRTGEDIFYWREGRDEIDFILKSGKSIFGIEVKSGRKKIGKGLESFKRKFPSSKVALIDQKNYFEFERDPMRFLKDTVT